MHNEVELAGMPLNCDINLVGNECPVLDRSMYPNEAIKNTLFKQIAVWIVP